MTQDIKKPADRTPIRIEKLLFTSANAYGVKLPDGTDGRNERIVPFITAGVQGDIKVEIEWRPWLRMFRVTKSRKGSDGWLPMGRPFMIPEAWAVSVVAED